MPDIADELDDERRHLTHARACLTAMRERAQTLGDVGGDAFASESLGRTLHQRVASLADDGKTPLFFGRIDYAGTAERFHIGRRHVVDSQGDPVVVDWRAPISLPFYRATAREPMDVELRRRFGFAAGELTSLEDERLVAGADLGTDSRILVEEIERPRVGPMRDIVATIQPDQDEIVRAALSESVCVQGAPGTGKTAVGLHRAAYLLYTYRERLRRSGVLVVGPNRAFLSYIANVLPALGEVDVTQLTVEELVPSVPVTGDDPPAVARLKGDARLAAVIRRAVYDGVRRPTDAIVIAEGSHRWRVEAGEFRGIVRDLLASKVPYDVARRRLHTLVAESVRRQMEAAGGAPDDRAVARLAAAPEVRDAVDAVWPHIDAMGLIRSLLRDRDHLATVASDVLTVEEQAQLQRAPARSRAQQQWSLADAFLVDEAAGVLTRVPSVGHVIVDEAQDLSPMQCRALARRAATGSVTVLGDLAQGTAPSAAATWAETMAHLGKPAGRIVVLTQGYRVPREVLDFANRLVPAIAAGVPPATSVRRSPGSLSVRAVAPGELLAAAAAAAREALVHEGSLGVIAADRSVAVLTAALVDAGVAAVHVRDAGGEANIAIVPASLAKGLEYDSVIVVEPAEIVEAEERGLRRLYVVLTRAVSRLTVVHARPLPPPLAVDRSAGFDAVVR